MCLLVHGLEGTRRALGYGLEGPRRALVHGLALMLLTTACGATAREPAPVALLGATPRSGAAWAAIRGAYADPETPPEAIRESLLRFIRDYPDDTLVPLARIVLALVVAGEEDLDQADAQLALTSNVAPGSARDLWTVARARSLRLHRNPEAGLALLRPLVGKMVDPLARTVFEQELTLLALQTHREFEAISYMDAWLRVTPEDDKPKASARVAALVSGLPRSVLVAALEAMRRQGAASGYGSDIERILAERLVRIATTTGDAALARLLIDRGAGGLTGASDAALALGELATSRRGLNVVLGRTLGLLLPTESSALRDESSAALRGVMWALGVPRSGRKLARDDSIRLVSRDDAADPERTDGALDELIGEGAAIVVAGLNSTTAARALAWGESHRVPVIALVSPDGAAPGDYGFLLGSSRRDMLASLARAVPELASQAVVPVVDASDLAAFPIEGGKAYGLSFLPPASCDLAVTRAGDPRFPVLGWRAAQAHTFLVAGSPDCAEDLLAELAASHIGGLAVLTPEAAASERRAFSPRALAAHAGVMPAPAPEDPRAVDFNELASVSGPVTWWTALGRDAAILAAGALRNLSTTEAVDGAAVSARRQAARRALAGVHAALWTTEATGWDADRTMPRTVSVEPLPGPSSPTAP